jgi:hypothetical protein
MLTQILADLGGIRVQVVRNDSKRRSSKERHGRNVVRIFERHFIQVGNVVERKKLRQRIVIAPRVNKDGVEPVCPGIEVNSGAPDGPYDQGIMLEIYRHETGNAALRDRLKNEACRAQAGLRP